MLKAWKDSSRRSRSGERASSQGAQLRGNSIDEPTLVAVNKASSSGVVLEDVTAQGSSTMSLKRRRGSGNQGGNPDFNRLSKKGKGNNSASQLAQGKPACEGFRVPSSSAEQILEHAKIHNTIAIFSPSDDVADLSSKFLMWNIEHLIAPLRKVSIVVVDNEAHVDEMATKISIKSPLKVAVCHDPTDTAGWVDMSQNQIIVSSTNTLLDRLTRGIFTMSQLLALVIIDAQTVLRTGSALTNVLKRFYQSTSALARPRVLAFSSPVANSDAEKMERLLDAKVALPFAQKLRPTEVVIQYEPAHANSDTGLTQQVRELDVGELICRNLFRDAHYALNELGPCASDLVWRRATKEAETIPEYDHDPMVNAENDIRELIKNWVFSMPNANPSSRGFNVTPKFSKLIQVLKACRPYGNYFRGIIFVQRTSVANVMADLLRTINDDLGFLRPFALTGELPIIDIHNQLDVWQSFDTGKYNLLVLTKSLEDLDLPPSSLVVRYNAFESQLSYAYACARTCRPLGRLIHMVENGNDVHRRILSQFCEGAFSDRWIDIVINNGGVSIPPIPLTETRHPSRADDEDDLRAEPYIEDPSTGGRLYEQDAITALYRLTANLQKANSSGKPLLITKEDAGPQKTRKWTCTVVLPPGLPFEYVTGSVRLTPAHARRSAAYDTCVQLFEHGAFDHSLFPAPQRFEPTTGDSKALAADKVSGNRCYPRKRTQFWTNSIRLSGRRLFPFVVCVEGQNADYAPILILTRQPLPHIPPFRLFFSGMSETIRNFRGTPLLVDEQRLEVLRLFTLRICRAISNKPFSCPLEKMAYMFAPLKLPEQSNCQSVDFCHLLDYIPWDIVELAGKEWMVRFDLDELRSSPEGVHDMVIQDRLVEFTRRYYATHLRRDLTPLSKPEDSPRETEYANLVEYCKARRKGFEGLLDYTQPLIEVSKAAAAGNHLNPSFGPFTEPVKAAVKYVIPELSAKFTIPASTFRTALLLPSITRRIEDFLIVHDLNASLFDYSLHEDLLLAAISAPSAGFEVDYERLELFGDSFLKYLASAYVFVTNPAQHEGALHAARQRIISNKVLMQSADRIGLPPYVQSKPFSHKLWNPPNFSVDPLPSSNNTESAGSGNEGSVMVEISYANKSASHNEPELPGSSESADPQIRGGKKPQDENATHWLGDKTIADVAEAIIGAAYLSGGQDNALQAAKALQVPIPLTQQWHDFRRKALVPPSIVTRPLRQGTTDAVETIIGYRFRHPHLLAQALTHASIEGYDTTGYERLEFLGDAILDFMVVRHIFSHNKKLSPGAMTMLKGAMVSNSALAAVCVSCGLHKHLHFDSYPLATAFETYVRQLELKEQQEIKAATQEDRNPGQYWLDVEPPKALSDIVESIIGAIYVSDGFTSNGAEAFFNRVLKPFYDRHITLKTLSHHPTKILFELLQSHGCQKFELVKERCNSTQEARCDCVIHQITLASAVGGTVQAAGRAASMLALDALQGDPGFLSRTCDCRGRLQSHKARQVLVDQMVAVETAEENTISAPAQ
ncbi:hypothetical protein BS17DRAFT_775670 [Gyrodon lividus]|nr:hypothetical protein BS17DRAFT_775670 [Gyrodon lividus]